LFEKQDEIETLRNELTGQLGEQLGRTFAFTIE
jgi:hypothetical protein